MSNSMRLNSVMYNRTLRYIVQRRGITTSSKNQDTLTTGVPAVKDICPPVEKPSSGRKNWVTYGFETKDYEADRSATHSIFFSSVTLCLVLGGYYMLYMPDFNLRDWAQREAYLELRRRELAGQPLVDSNLIDPSKMVLPTDEELGEQDIII